MQQKLISIFFGSWCAEDQGIQPQLEHFLTDGWIVKSITSVGSSSSGSTVGFNAAGWALVLLEKE